MVPIRPYVNVVFKRNRRIYVELIRHVVEIGKVWVTDVCISEVGMFFVARKDGSLRLIIDARPADSLMVKPPRTPLCSRETLSGIESMEAAGHSFGEQMSISDV